MRTVEPTKEAVKLAQRVITNPYNVEKCGYCPHMVSKGHELLVSPNKTSVLCFSCGTSNKHLGKIRMDPQVCISWRHDQNYEKED